ncbi:MAG: AAA family ATPase [Rhodoferax sp.]
MPPITKRLPRETFHTQEEAPAVFKLWLLRLLVPLDAQRKFITSHGFRNDELARLLGLGRWIDSADDGGADDSDDELSFDDDDNEETISPSFDPNQVRTELRRLHRVAERQSPTGELPPFLRSNLDRLATLVGLNPVDARILEFAVMLHSHALLVQTTDWLGELSTARLFLALSVLLALPEQQVREALAANSLLSRCGLLTCQRQGVGTLECKLELLSYSFADNILSDDMDPVALLRENVAPCQQAQLTLADYAHIEPSLGVLQPYLLQALEQRRKGVNIFIYGMPGNGKTQLSRALAAAFSCELFQVASENDDGDAVTAERRLCAYRAAQSILTKRRVMLVFDEAADVFDDGDALFGRKSTAQTRKAWINRALEENPIPTLWLSNSIACLDPAFVRRFDMVIELPIAPRQQRQRVLAEACGDLLDAPALARLAESEVLAPAVAARAAAVVRSIHQQLGTQAAGQAVERLIGHTLQAQGYPAILRNDPNRLPETYDPAFLNADADLAALATGLARQQQGRLCLYGPSGTGKTAYARWLAQQLGLGLQVQRGSDLISKWVGDSEKQICHAFRQAEQDKAVLLIDEVDGFLQDRRDMHHSWEVTMVNEMLTQMESFAGVFIASTNLMDGLEPAALRRFDLKVRFDFLKPAQAWELLRRQCAALGLAEPLPELRGHLDRLSQLTPGDFAAVARQHRFRPVESAAALLAALDGECGH